MNTKTLIWIGAFAGGFLGGFIPRLWGSGSFSMSGIFLSGFGAILGIWIMFKLTR
ncbi:MAG TPA: hypothetical protein VEC13_01880 [Candidatus Paceibacterota bacterium]|nr:hypothetical protein [Candidatus Paceibacterota bacterium]